ncbi:UPF0481 protein At3g47200-like [Prosopis cineraria]|uniref:UPF0481 protein At3g47200-like n=1 Tax=Prosopis cineraria TaxID=364024 RepID=UPI00240F5F5F|nr:UPF0481 protein At3g47200-like [Prosopis cineraria]
MELFLRRSTQSQYIHDNDPLFTTTVNTKNIERDLLLLENQLPFYILEKLYELVPTTRLQKEHSNFLDLARQWFKIYDPYRAWSRQEINKRMKLKQGWDRPNHFIDVIRYIFIPRHFINTGYYDKFDPVIRSTTKLQRVWISFEPVSERSFLDITFKKVPILSWLGLYRSRLQIPQAMIDDLSEFILGNLILFEQYHYPYHAYISSYVNLIACLVQKEGDVNLLVESGIVLNKLSTDKELIDLFRTLDNQLQLDYSCYKDLS